MSDLIAVKYQIKKKLEPQVFSIDTTMLEQAMGDPEAAAKLSSKQLFNQAFLAQQELSEAGVSSDIKHEWDKAKHLVTVTITPTSSSIKRLKEKIEL